MRYILSLLLAVSLGVPLWGQSASQALLISQHIAAGGGPATLTKVGSGTGATASPYTVTLTGSVSIGQGLIIAMQNNTVNGGVVYPITVATSQSDSCQTDAQIIQSTFSVGEIQVSSCYVSHTLTSGVDSITITPSGAACGGSCDNDMSFIVYAASSFPSTSWKDASSTNTTSGDAPVSSSLTPVANPTIAFALFASQAGAFTSFGNIMASAATGKDSNFLNGGAANKGISTEWRELSATTAGTATMTGNGGWNWAELFVTYKEH